MRNDKFVFTLQYFHHDPSSIVKAMSQALVRVATGEPSGAEEAAEPDAIMCPKLMPFNIASFLLRSSPLMFDIVFICQKNPTKNAMSHNCSQIDIAGTENLKRLNKA